MSGSGLARNEVAVELPADAPTVRLTTGFDGANPRTWLLKRPATIIGSRRPAHIVIHHHSVAEAHCAVICSGQTVLLFDFCTDSGTVRNGGRIRLVHLNHRDTVRAGDTEFLVEIISRSNKRRPVFHRRSIAGPVPPPLRADAPLVLSRDDGQAWRLTKPAGAVGRRPGLAIQLDDDQVREVHALLFCCGEHWYVQDLGTGGGVLVNGWPARVAPLAVGDAVQMGSHKLTVQPASFEAPEVAEFPELAPAPAAPAPDPPQPQIAPPSITLAPPPPPAAVDDGELDVDRRLADLKEALNRTWSRLNKWKLDIVDRGGTLTDAQTNLSRRIAELDARDAALRGLLHDLTRFHEQLTQCHAELARLRT